MNPLLREYQDGIKKLDFNSYKIAPLEAAHEKNQHFAACHGI